MGSVRIGSSQIFSCKFSLACDDIVSCTASQSNELYGPGCLCLYHINNSQYLNSIETFPWSSALLDHCWSSKENKICTSSSDGQLHLWDLSATNLTRHKPILLFLGHSAAIPTVVWNNDTNIIVSGSVDCSVKFWDITKNCSIMSYKLDDAVLQIACTSNSSLSVAILANRKINLIDDRVMNNLKELPYNQILSCDWSPCDPYLLYAAGWNGNICLIDIRQTKDQLKCVTSHHGPIRKIKCIPTAQRTTISGGFDGNTVMTDLKEGRILERISHHSNIVYDVDCSLFHSLFMDCSWDSLLHVFSHSHLYPNQYSNKL